MYPDIALRIHQKTHVVPVGAQSRNLIAVELLEPTTAGKLLKAILALVAQCLLRHVVSVYHLGILPAKLHV